MAKFAHMADIHLGAHREPALRKLEIRAFHAVMDQCMELHMDFILIAGDLFHVGVPDLTVVNEAVKKMRQVRDAGIPIYVIYGSHDYTPNGTSIIDILDSVGVLTKVVKLSSDGQNVKLDFFTDPKTGAKLAGISGRRIGLESKYYEQLDRDRLEKEKGFKIFAFHCGLSEFKPEFLREMETIPITMFPNGFDYYAGGHIHERNEFKLPGYDKVVFPGPLFTGYGKDIERTAKGEKRGFYIVEFQDKLESVKFIENKPFESLYFEFDVSGKNAIQAGKDLDNAVNKLDVREKILVLKVYGELSGGKTSELGFADLTNELINKGALYVHLNRYGLVSKEYSAVQVMGEDPATIENRMFKENIGSVKVSQAELTGQSGVGRAVELLRILRQPAKINEQNSDYEERMVEDGISLLRIQEQMNTEAIDVDN